MTRLSASVICGLLASTAGSALAAGSASALVQPAEEKPDAELLRDFIHYVKIAAYELAEATGQQLLDRGLTPSEIVDLVDSINEFTRYQEAVATASRIPMLVDIAADLSRSFRQGKLDRARDPDEITRNIGLLTKGLRARTIGRERLMAAGEYALPQMLDAYMTGDNVAERAEVQRVLIDMGRQSIIPLATALNGLDPARQEAVVEVLGQIKYRTSLPYLTDLHQRTSVDAVRAATGRAIVSLGGDPQADIAGLFYLLADAYYNERQELTSFPGESFQLIWGYDPGVGLLWNPINTEVFHEAMAMRSAETSLRLNPRNPETLAIWLAANFSREIDSPEGYENPVYASERRGAEYFAVAAGAETSQRVLRRAIDDRDTPLARDAINAIQQTAGSRQLWGEPIADRQPMLEALNYPNRRVQYETALAIGKAQPATGFTGSERVVPLLASAVRDASARFAVVLAGHDREEYSRLRRLLESDGYSVLPPADGGLSDIQSAINDAPGIDLIMTSLSVDATELAISETRSHPKLAVSPVFALVRPDEVETLLRRYRNDQMVSVRRGGIGDAAVINAASDLLMAASGGAIGTEEAEAYSARALTVLRDLAVSGNTVLEVADAAAPLIQVLGTTSDESVLMDVAEVLAHVGQPRAQTALMERALASSEQTRIALMSKVADSGKRHGNMLSDRLVRRLTQLAADSDFQLATAAAGVMGALDVPHTNLVPLLLGDTDRATASMAGP